MSNAVHRRIFLALLLGAATLSVALPSYADSNSGSGGGGGNSGGNSGSGDDGPGGDPGSGSDDSDDSDDNDSDEDSRIGSSEATAASAAVSQGKAVSLTKLIQFLNTNYPGKILDVDLKKSSDQFQYHLKILKQDGKVLKLRLDALTLQQL